MTAALLLDPWLFEVKLQDVLGPGFSDSIAVNDAYPMQTI